MALPVDVRSVDVLRDFRAALCAFGEDVRSALAGTDMEISRVVDWLTNDRRLYWQAEIKRRRDLLSQAKSELHRKRTSRMFGHEGSLSEPHELVRTAMQRLEEAERKLERVKRWAQPLQQAVMEYRGASRPLADALDSDLERGLASLDRMVGALEQYLSDAPPSTAYVQALRHSVTPTRIASPAPDRPWPVEPAPEPSTPDEPTDEDAPLET
jgi:hypothetical protein